MEIILSSLAISCTVPSLVVDAHGNAYFTKFQCRCSGPNVRQQSLAERGQWNSNAKLQNHPQSKIAPSSNNKQRSTINILCYWAIDIKIEKLLAPLERHWRHISCPSIRFSQMESFSIPNDSREIEFIKSHSADIVCRAFRYQMRLNHHWCRNREKLSIHIPSH